VILRRRRFTEVITRQLDLFEADHAGLLRDCAAAEEAYDRAGRDEAEQRYGDYLDLVETAAELLAELRDGFARTLDEDAADAYELAFNRAVAKRFPRLSVAIGDA
jgi:hypothetical protein